METIRSSEESILRRAARRKIPEYGVLFMENNCFLSSSIETVSGIVLASYPIGTILAFSGCKAVGASSSPLTIQRSGQKW
jgi:hypothetical protein